MADIIDGKQVADSVIDAVKTATAALEKETGVKTGLAVVIVGDDPASHTYVGAKGRMAKGRMAKECGFTSIQHTLPATPSSIQRAICRPHRRDGRWSGRSEEKAAYAEGSHRYLPSG